MPLQVATTALPRHTASVRLTARCRSRTLRVAAYLKSRSSQQLQKSVLQIVEAVNGQDWAGLQRFLAPNIVLSDRVWSSVDFIGREKVRRVYAELWGAYPDYTMHVEDVLARDDASTVAVHFTATATNFGEWRDYPASGRRSTMSGVSLFVFDQERDDQVRHIITYRQPSAEEHARFLGHDDLF